MVRNILCASLIVALVPACGGGSGAADITSNQTASPIDTVPPTPAPAPATAPAAPEDSAPTQVTSTGSCSSLAAIPTKPASAKKITDFGVAPSDSKDQASAIQAALDAMKPGEWMVFPAGKYLHSKSLRVRVPGVVLLSEGATLLATNPDDTAMMMQADNTSLYGFRFHTVTNDRGSALRHARIVIAPTGNTSGPRVKGVTVRNNIVENAGAPGTSLANGSSASGIFIYHADGFLVAENTVKRTLADAIHTTGGSINGRVIKNTVRESGDDMVAVVSYMAAEGTSVSSMTSNMATLRDQRLNRNILIAHNDVSGQYWGRGITVVGGENVTIQNNRISDTTHGAGVLLARESGYRSFGVKNVIVRDNTIANVQTAAPLYSAGKHTTWDRTGHAGIEVHSLATSEEMANSAFAAAVSVERILLENNTVSKTHADGIRLGVGGGRVGAASVIGNKMTGVNKTSLNVLDTNSYCTGNTDDGNPTTSNLCSGSRPTVTGATLTCSA